MRTHGERAGPVRTPLGEHSVLRSDRIDETAEFLRRKSIDLRPPRPRSWSEGFSAAIDAAYLPRMYVAYMEYGAAVEMTALAPIEADYGVHLPLGGWIDVAAGDQTVACVAGGAAVASPCDRISVTASEACQRLLLSVRREALTSHLAAMIGEAPTGPLVFHAATDPSSAGGRRLVNAVRFIAGELECREAVDGNDVVVAQFEQFLMTLLLMAQPNTYSEALSRRDNGVRPRDVKRAIDYIQANLDGPIALEDLVAVSGVPGRTLHQHFRDFVGTSPIGYARKARYDRVHAELARLDGEGTVTEVATRWGFTHMGRFSAEYRRRFGELPSVTAGRRKPD